MSNISQNLDKLHKNIDETCKKYQKDKDNISLIAVSKTTGCDKIEEAIKWGCKDFGENRVEEIVSKWPDLLVKYPETNLHLIGHLQSKKVKNAVKFCSYIHSVDSIKLAHNIKNEMDKQQKYPKIFLQVNLAQEEAKTGFIIDDLDNVVNIIKNEVKLPIFGLMCIPPIDEEASLYFALLNKIAAKYQIENLSMGMTSDYISAIALNSSFIRIGTAIFGKR